MKFKINRFYTENLNISIFPESIPKQLDLIINLSTKIHGSDEKEDMLNFKISYNVLCKNAPLSLTWEGGFFLKFDKKVDNIEDLNVDDILNDENIDNYLNDTVNNLSFLISGELPTVKYVRENNK